MHKLNSASTIRSYAAAICSALLITIIGAPHASAAQHQESSQLRNILRSSDPATAIAKLSPAAQAALKAEFASLTPGTPVVVGGAVAQVAAASTAATSGCWYKYLYQPFYNAGVHEADLWMQLHWCGNGTSITSYSISNTGGTAYNGFSYDGVINHGYRNMGWEVRAYTQYKLHLGPLSFYPCLQIRGGASGLYSIKNSSACSLN
jgi:hypothetical protein